MTHYKAIVAALLVDRGFDMDMASASDLAETLLNAYADAIEELEPFASTTIRKLRDAAALLPVEDDA
jgi:hypothetical protein